MEPFVVTEPQGPARPLVASIPHAGTWLPPGYAERLSSEGMRGLPMTDWHLAQLFDFLPELGITVIAAQVSRFVIDLNRSPDGRALYPGRFETGLVPLEDFDGNPVFSAPPREDEIRAAQREIHEPYHRKVDELLDLRRSKGRVVLLDLHSVTPFSNRISGPLKYDIMLGDRDGASCDAWLTDAAELAYRSAGLSVVRNDPYKGGWITTRTGQLAGVDALQIEMNWAAYMDPEHPAQAVGTPRFGAAQQRLRSVFQRIGGDVTRRLSRA